jgi:hypothetical protein
LFGLLSVFGRRIKGMIRLRPNTDSTPNKPVTLPHNQLFDTLRGHESHPHCRDTVLRGNVTSVYPTLLAAVKLRMTENTNTQQRVSFPLQNDFDWELSVGWGIFEAYKGFVRIFPPSDAWLSL